MDKSYATTLVDDMSDKDEGFDPRLLSGKKVMPEVRIPEDLLTGPKVPEGLDDGWFLEVGPLFMHARILSDEEAVELHWKVMPGPGDERYRSSYNYISTIIELTVTNRGTVPIVCQWNRDHKMTIVTHDGMESPVECSNYQYKNEAAKNLNKGDPLIEELGSKDSTVPPNGTVRRLITFSKFRRTKSLLPEEINKVFIGQWSLWPVRHRYPPPALAVPVEGIVRVVSIKPRVEKGEEYALIDSRALLRGKNEFDETVDFITDHPVKVRASDGIGFVRVTATRPGDKHTMGAGTINEPYARARDMSSVTNPIPTWVPGIGPPKGPFPGGSITRLWLSVVGKRDPLVAAAGHMFLATADRHLWAMDEEGKLVQKVPIPWHPYSICYPSAEGPVYMGEHHSLQRVDLQNGTIKLLASFGRGVESVGMRADGTLVALLQGSVLQRLDTDGKLLEAWPVTTQYQVACARESNIMAVWNSAEKVQLLDGDGSEIALYHWKDKRFDAYALSRTGQHVALGEGRYNVEVYDHQKDLVCSFPTLGSPHAIAFHPTKPYIVAATRSSYLHVHDIRRGPVWVGKLEGEVANSVAFGSGPSADMVILAMMDGHLHLFDLGV